MQASLVLLFKRPMHGQGKQRLAAHIGKSAACVIAEQLFAVAADLLAAWAGPKVAAPASDSDRCWAETVLTDCRFMTQGEGNLGQRILTLDAQLRESGSLLNIYIGSDAPLLTSGLCQQVAEELKGNDIVLVPSSDGGVSVMACARPWPDDLEILSWSTPVLAEQLVCCCKAQGYSVAMLSGCDDIDELSDLAQFVQEANGLQLSALQAKLLQQAKQILEVRNGTDS